jgi:hypothetical protein
MKFNAHKIEDGIVDADPITQFELDETEEDFADQWMAKLTAAANELNREIAVTFIPVGVEDPNFHGFWLACPEAEFKKLMEQSIPVEVIEETNESPTEL